MTRSIALRPYRDRLRPSLRFVVNFAENGKRSRRFFETKREAETFAEMKRIERENQGREGAEFPSELRVMAKRAEAMLLPFGKTILDAAEHYARFLQLAERSCSVSELAAEVVASKRADSASRAYLQDLKTRLGRFASAFGGELVSSITPPQIDDWLRGLPVAPTSRNNYRRVLVVMFNFGVQRGYAAANPALAAAKAKAPGGPPGILSVTQTARLLEAAPPEVLPLLAVGCFAGLRPAELARLDWSEIDLGAGLIEVKAEKSKTARRRFVKIQPNLAEWLAPCQRQKGPLARPNLRRLMQAARDAAGLKEWPPNALRHGFASYHLARFNDAAALALEMGHTDSGMIFRHYRELVKPKEAARYWELRPASAGNHIVAMSEASL